MLLATTSVSLVDDAGKLRSQCGGHVLPCVATDRNNR